MSSAELEKAEQPPAREHAERIAPIDTHATYIDGDNINALTEEHKQYLLHRHGTLELDPLPGYGDADPFNWPLWKKVTNLLLVAFHAMMATFTASSIQSAFPTIAKDLSQPLQRTTYLTSLFIAILGGAPLFWRPVADRFGRRPVFIISLICSAVGNIGCAESKSYATMALCRAITAWFISPAAAIGSAVVKETFFKRERARYIGIWTLMVTLGVPFAPFIFGFVAERVNYRWIYWILAITNGVQLALYTFLGPETRYIRKGVEHHGSTRKQEYWAFGRIDPTPFSIWDFLEPLRFILKPCVIIPAAAYSMVFLFANILVTVEIPQLFGAKFNFGPQQLGYQFVGTIVGSIVGELVGGTLSDFWMNSRARRIGSRPPPEFRLWLSYGAFLLSVTGVIVFLVQIQNAAAGHYNVSPIVGAGIASAGNQIITTVLITYAVDCYPDQAGSIGVSITFVRQIWGFIGPFWFPQMFENVGLYGSAGIATGLIMAVGFLPTIFIQWKGVKLR